MSFILSGAIKGAVAAVAGISVITPVAYSISGDIAKEKFKLNQKSDFNRCLEVIEGNVDDDGDNYDGFSNRKLLACQSSLNTKTHTNFYLWNRAKWRQEQLPREVNQVEVQNSGGQIKIVLTFASVSASPEKETINFSRGGWDFLNGLNLKESCEVDFSNKQMTCLGTNSKVLNNRFISR